MNMQPPYYPYILDFVEDVDWACGAGLLRHVLKSQSRATLASEVQSSAKPWYSGVTVSIYSALTSAPLPLVPGRQGHRDYREGHWKQSVSKRKL